MAREQSTTATVTRSQLAQPKVKLTFDDMPEAARTANAQAVNARDWYQRAVALEQLLLVAAAVAGAVIVAVGANNIVRGAVVAALAGAFAVRGLRSLAKPDAKWYGLRLTAEDIQSQAWRYVMGAAPYDAARSDDPLQSPEAAFIEACQAIWNKSTLPDWKDRSSSEEITPKMRDVHDLSLPDRISVYVSCRLQDQCKWYRSRANRNRRWGRFWNIFILAVEGVAGAATGIHFLGLPALDSYGLATTVVAGIAVWTHMKQYATLEQRYMSMARTLQSYVDLLTIGLSPEKISPEGWSKLVNRTEQLMEQEHENWLNLYKGLAGNQQQEPNWQQIEQQLAQAGVTLRVL